MAESLSETSRCNFLNILQNWGATILRGVHDPHKAYLLSEEETTALLRANYGELYPQYCDLQEQHLFPRSMQGQMLYLRLAVPGYCISMYDWRVQATRDLPLLQERESNSFPMESDRWHPLLPQRVHDDVAQLLRYAAALKDVVKCVTAYSRARYLLAQWPSAALMMPKHVRDSLTHRRFQRGLPKDIPLLKQETLDTLALMSLLEPIPENRY